MTRAKGVRGEVAVEPLTWDPERFDELTEVWLERDGQTPRSVRIERWRADTRRLLVKIAGVDSPEAAREEVVGGYLTIPRDQVVPRPDDEYYVFEIVGCEVFDENGDRLGEVSDVLEMPSTDLYAIRLAGGGEVLVPAVRNFVRTVDIGARRIVVRGLQDLLDAERI